MELKAPSDYRGLCERTMVFSSSDPGATRTHDQWLKRPLLYQLSYRIIFAQNDQLNLLNYFLEKNLIDYCFIFLSKSFLSLDDL